MRHRAGGSADRTGVAEQHRAGDSSEVVLQRVTEKESLVLAVVLAEDAIVESGSRLAGWKPWRFGPRDSRLELRLWHWGEI